MPSGVESVNGPPIVTADVAARAGGSLIMSADANKPTEEDQQTKSGRVNQFMPAIHAVSPEQRFEVLSLLSAAALRKCGFVSSKDGTLHPKQTPYTLRDLLSPTCTGILKLSLPFLFANSMLCEWLRAVQFSLADNPATFAYLQQIPIRRPLFSSTQSDFSHSRAKYSEI